jgi:hypothetical protein
MPTPPSVVKKLEKRKKVASEMLIIEKASAKELSGPIVRLSDC